MNVHYIDRAQADDNKTSDDACNAVLRADTHQFMIAIYQTAMGNNSNKPTNKSKI